MLILSISQVHPFPAAWPQSLSLISGPHFFSPRLQQPPNHFLVPVGSPGTNFSCRGQSHLSRHKPARRGCHWPQLCTPRSALGATCPPAPDCRPPAPRSSPPACSAGPRLPLPPPQDLLHCPAVGFSPRGCWGVWGCAGKPALPTASS